MVYEQEALPQSLTLYDISVKPTEESINTLKWMKDHPGKRGIHFTTIHGEERNFTYEVNSDGERYVEKQHIDSPGHIRLMYDNKLKRTVIAKAATKEIQSGWSHQVNITQEAHFTAADQHPNIATVYDIASDGKGELYMIMEYLPNGTVEQWMKEDHEITEIARLIDRISAALDHVNKVRGLVYADMKPLNVGFDEFWNPKLIDFELAAKMDDKGLASSLPGGTRNYAAPEQLKTGDMTVRTDVYSLAATVFSILTSPCEDLDVKDIRDQFENNEQAHIPFRKSYEKKLSEKQKKKLSGIMHRALNYDPDIRQTTVMEFNQELGEVLFSFWQQ